ncbi:MAG: C2 domain-containing protein [Myxococcota bacterium]
MVGTLVASGCGSDPVGLGGTTGSSGGDDGPSTAMTLAGDDNDDTPPDVDDDGPDPDADTGECAGCIDDAGGCQPGDAVDACGLSGAACVACMGAEQCAEGECLEPPSCDVDNCDGCCDGDTCVESPDDAACGSDGLQCTACPEGSVCEEGACALPCEATCDGCCAESGKCIGADEQSADGCGMEAAACEICGVGLDCVGGGCVSATCLNTCPGCCVGDMCMDGTEQSQCGSGGDACFSCSDGTTCEPEGCVPDPMALWDLTLLSGEVSLTDPNGEPWDAFNGLPDPFVTIDLIGAPVSSSVADDTVFPVWDELVAEGVTTVQLMDELTFTVVDDDVAFDNTIGACAATIPVEQFGSFYDLDCVVDDFEAWSLSFEITPSL